MRLNQVTVRTRDVERSLAFYRLLGLQLIVWSPNYVRLVGTDGGSSFAVQFSDQPVRSGTIVYLECDDVDAEVARLMRAGLHFVLMPTDQPWLWREARLVDPDGNPVCIYHAGTYRLDPPWRLVDLPPHLTDIG